MTTSAQTRTDSPIRRDKHNRILDAAVRVFARLGYHGARVSDIAKEAGIAYGLVYHYFKNKEEILNTIFEDRWSGFVEALHGIGEGESSTEDKLVSVTALCLSLYFYARWQDEAAPSRIAEDSYETWMAQKTGREHARTRCEFAMILYTTRKYDKAFAQLCAGLPFVPKNARGSVDRYHDLLVKILLWRPLPKDLSPIDNLVKAFDSRPDESLSTAALEMLSLSLLHAPHEKNHETQRTVGLEVELPGEIPRVVVFTAGDDRSPVPRRSRIDPRADREDLGREGAVVGHGHAIV